MGFEINGLNELQKRFGEMPELLEKDLQKVVKKNTDELERQTRAHAYFRRYPVKNPKAPLTGQLRNSIMSTLEPDGLAGIVGTHTVYAPYVEYGTRFMRAQPYMKPAFKKVSKEFIKDIENLVK